MILKRIFKKLKMVINKVKQYIIKMYMKMNIYFYIDKINVINKSEPETKDNSKPKSK